MPLRQTIGISLALLMASTGAIAKTPEKTTSYHAIEPPNGEPVRSANRNLRSRTSRSAHFRWPARLAFHRGEPRLSASAADTTPAQPNWGPMHATGYQEIGRAAWYDLVGSRTSSGERLDTETPTAAHRSLPLGTCVKVTNLDTGSSVIVKINDRGPFNRRFIIDLSPRAADAIGMRHEGVAAVAVEQLAAGAPASGAATPTEAVYRGQVVNLAR